ncbi:UNVERIFIED_CONTAM: Transcription initiation factor TFIID subunit [Sesamum radiatum]|uniref:Transcription initiation factor TFIID subunit n=1 Tax=Sesamum radiatum TaxID=300843 RepID=A0AAW2R5G8_SESRA
MQGMGMTGSLGTTSSMRPAGVPSHQLRPSQSSLRPQTTPSSQSPAAQIDPSEKLDPEVEDILVEIAEDFVESITTFGCSLAKHRKSTTLEAKDILLHLERNWNMTLPGFGGDEIKTYKKPIVSDIHRERLAAIKKSIVNNDMVTKNPGGPSGGSAKGHLAKGPASIIGSPPNPKIREAA